jgi:hypothetical protein
LFLAFAGFVLLMVGNMQRAITSVRPASARTAVAAVPGESRESTRVRTAMHVTVTPEQRAAELEEQKRRSEEAIKVLEASTPELEHMPNARPASMP